MIYELYGWRDIELTAAAEQVAAALGVELVPRESSYTGEYFMAGLPGEENFEVVPNRDAEDELSERDFPEHTVLLYANEVRDPELRRAQLERVPGLDRLRSEDLS